MQLEINTLPQVLGLESWFCPMTSCLEWSGVGLDQLTEEKNKDKGRFEKQSITGYTPQHKENYLNTENLYAFIPNVQLYWWIEAGLLKKVYTQYTQDMS